MLTRINRLAFAICLSVITAITAASFCAAQSATKSGHGSMIATKRPAGPNKSEVEASLEVLARLRAMRDCWNDPYQVLVGDDPKYENSSLFFRCGDEYPLRLAEAQTAVSEAVTWLKDPTLIREITAAIRFSTTLKLYIGYLKAAATSSSGSFVCRMSIRLLINTIFPTGITRSRNSPSTRK